MKKNNLKKDIKAWYKSLRKCKDENQRVELLKKIQRAEHLLERNDGYDGTI